VYIARHYARPALMVKIVRTSANVTTTVHATRRPLSVHVLAAGRGSSAICHASPASTVSGAERSVQKDI
jgi:hypothetical protein